MSELVDTKVCPLCAETIKAAARVCPCCRSKQGRFAVWRQELPPALMGVALVSMAIVMIVLASPEEEGVGGRSFARHGADLAVLHSAVERAGVGPDYWLTGIVTNRGEHPWRIHSVEVRFLDGHGNLLDVRHSDLKEIFVVQPRQNHGFRAKLGEMVLRHRGEHQVRVQMATDGDRFFKSD